MDEREVRHLNTLMQISDCKRKVQTAVMVPAEPDLY